MSVAGRVADLLDPDRIQPTGGWSVQGVSPDAVVAPATVDEAGAVLHVASSEGWGVEPAGAGGWLGWGRPPERLDLLVTTGALAGEPEHQPEDLTVSVDAGVTLDTLQALLRRSGQWLPLDPPGGGPGTLGALVAGAEAGPLRAGYGTPRDHVLGIEVLTGDGRRLRFGGRVVKNVAGYDGTRLLVGSRGTLGLITRIQFRLHPVPERDVTVAVAADDVAPLLGVTGTVRAARLEPAALELVSPGLAARAGLEERWTLLVRVHGNEDASDAIVETLNDLAASSVAVAPLDHPVAWDALGATEAAAALVARLAAGPASLADTLATAVELAPDTLVAAHAGDGIVRVMMDQVGDAGGLAERLSTARQAIASNGGSVLLASVPPGLAAEVDPFGEVGPALRLMRGLARVFDPAAVLARGRFVLPSGDVAA